MSWRKFRNLLAGLGPHTAIATLVSAKPGTGGTSRREQVIEFDMHDPAQEDAFLAMLVGKKPKRKRKQS